MRSSIRILALVLITSLLFSFGITSAQEKTVMLGLEGDPERFISTIWPMASGLPLMHLVFNSLVTRNTAMEMVPDLATEIEISEDGRTVTFQLRDDVYFHDGVQLTTEDVAFTYNMMAHPEYAGGQDPYVNFLEGYSRMRSGEAETISGIVVHDDFSISFTSKEPHAPAMEYMDMEIMPKHLLGQVPVKEMEVHPFNYNPVGSGPFKVEEYAPDRHVILRAYDDYFEGRPKIDRIIFRIASSEALLTSWLREEIDAVPISISELPIVEGSDFGFAYSYESERPTYLGLNCQSVFFHDARVRRALSYAMNRQELADLVLDGHGVPIALNYPPHMWAYDPDLSPITQDLDKAASLLDEAGWELNPRTGIREKDGLAFRPELIYVTDREPFQPDMAAMVQVQLREVGIDVRLRAWDSPSLWPTVLPRDRKADPETFDFMLASVSYSIGDPHAFRRNYLHSSAQPPHGINYMLFADEELDGMIEKQASIMDFETRRDFWYDELWPAVLHHSPYVPLVAPLTYFAVNQRFEGFEPSSNSRVNNVLNWNIQKD